MRKPPSAYCPDGGCIPLSQQAARRVLISGDTMSRYSERNSDLLRYQDNLNNQNLLKTSPKGNRDDHFDWFTWLVLTFMFVGIFSIFLGVGYFVYSKINASNHEKSNSTSTPLIDHEQPNQPYATKSSDAIFPTIVIATDNNNIPNVDQPDINNTPNNGNTQSNDSANTDEDIFADVDN